MTRNLILGSAGAVIGGLMLGGEGILPGFLAGMLFGVVYGLRLRVEALERRLDAPPAGPRPSASEAAEPPMSQEDEVPPPSSPPDRRPAYDARHRPSPPPPIRAKSSGPGEAADGVSEPETEAGRRRPSAPGDSREDASPPPSAAIPPAKEPPPPGPSEPPEPGWTAAVRNFVTGGNLVVRVGVVVLFFGVAFLLKYAAERGLVPIEVRLSGVALAGMALLAIGWRLRRSRKGYAVTLQGAGVGLLYLTLFTGARLYHLIPLGLTFALMVALVVLSGVLAVRQDALPLAVFGALGGFLAPVLASTGRGSHVALFAYYALLNAGIFQVAWRRSWRVLNLIGFVFTFGVASLWGARYYRPDHYATVQPFLILFFLFYVAISARFAHRLPPRLRGTVDGTLVFGLPIVAFALQARLVREMEYGLAFSALVLSGFYVSLARALWRRAVTGMRLLAESFLALGVVFGSLAIPLALDGQWTAAAWAMEGAALVWIGIRQRRVLARNFGLLLQIGAGLAFLVDGLGRSAAPPLLNGVFLGGIVVSGAALFSSAYLERNGAELRRWERGFPSLFLIWGLIWWLGAWAQEIDRHLPGAAEAPVFWMLVAATALALGELCRRLHWRSASVPAGLFLPATLLFAGGAFADSRPSHALAGWCGPAWAAALAVHFRLLFRFETRWRPGVVKLWHLGGALLMVFLAAWEASWWVDRWVAGAAWEAAVWGVLPAGAVLALLGPVRNLPWPVARHRNAYVGMAPAALLLWAVLWFLAACLAAGDPAPLPWIPALNPLDLAQALVLVVAVVWLRGVRHADYPEISPAVWRGLAFATGVGGFLWLNAVTGRAVHFWAGVRYAAAPLFDSDRFQAAISILWSLVALGLMAGATRRQTRSVWICGGALLALVVVKLFFLDLAGSGTVPRIVSFLGVGALMLVIGFLSPLPPRRQGESAGEKSAD